MLSSSANPSSLQPSSAFLSSLVTSPPPLAPVPALRREDYITDCGIAIISRWRNDPSHPEHLVRLAHIYEDGDDPEMY
jgi:hypothetical protein